jgi:hypothetical protein
MNHVRKNRPELSVPAAFHADDLDVALVFRVVDHREPFPLCIVNMQYIIYSTIYMREARLI